MQVWLIVAFFVLAFVMLSALTIAPVAFLFAHRTQQFRRATREVLPEFAEAHGLTLEPRGSADRLPRATGTYRDRPILVEFFLAQIPRRWPGWNEPTHYTQPMTRVRIDGVADDAAPLHLELPGAAFDGLPEPAGEFARRFAELRRGVLVRSDGAVTLEWSDAELRREVIVLAADLCVALADG